MADRHKNKWHTQVRDIPPDVWARIKAGAMARGLNIGEYITRSIILVEQVREAAQEADSEDEFYKRVNSVMEELGLDAVIA